MDIIGSGILTGILHAISQSLLIPVIIILILFVIFALISVGGLIAEYTSRKKFKLEESESLIRSLNSLNNTNQMKETIKESDINEEYKLAMIKVINNEDFGTETKRAFADKVIEEEELRMEKAVEKTDMVVRLGPTFGLMGTLIPMGPGLAALGAGNIELLAQAIIIAFDTTVTGLAASAVSYVVSKLRKRWYEEDLSNFEVLVNSTLEILEKNKF
ncbi:putative transporter protein [Methanobrevibacter arboriphilus JCM 13429 = DSM 1125]|uniref:Putative transporter protein n=1 Tax=Methanobrevibacter arboriphilus JCM 13429 = DSM 1125 TaxID=1300164 RepID=A0A1V6N2W4_METAZ|nr:MotA/TolQ/ExbB proton channel family protein [Methanobrevibacter arboriphilus]OQD59048.1 putative transporter protein [Methanobrevibacter arboriphilus JCM 13429 = DSM 1125]